MSFSFSGRLSFSTAWPSLFHVSLGCWGYIRPGSINGKGNGLGVEFKCIRCWKAESCPTLCDHMDCSPPGSSVLGISQTRIVEWVANSFSRGSSQPKDQTCVSCIPCIGRWILYCWATWEAINKCIQGVGRRLLTAKEMLLSRASAKHFIVPIWVFLVVKTETAEVVWGCRWPGTGTTQTLVIVYERHIGWGFPCGSDSKESSHNAGNLGLIPGLGRFPGEGKGYPLQYSGLENSMDCIVHGSQRVRHDWVTSTL